MRYLIGIAIGLVIVFNWSSIKSYFDKSISEQAGSSAVKSESTGAPPEAPKKQEDTSPPKQDMFKEFK